jgi:DNA (cytosine-5)-methyltransferase 1
MHILHTDRKGGESFFPRPLEEMASPTFLDLFCGAGGLSLGLARSGWTPLLAVDSWPDAAATYRRNFAEHEVSTADIRDLTLRRLSRMLDQEPDWVVGGPPCQGFSTVGKRQRRDPRNDLIREFHRVVRSLQPAGFMIENVLGLRDMGVAPAVVRHFERLGYAVTFHVLCAADYGIPQLRRRIVFVGHRDKGFLRSPMPSHDKSSYVTVWDAIGDLPPLGPGDTATEYVGPPFTTYQQEMRRASSSLQGHTASNHPAHLVKAISFIPDGGNRRSIPPRYQPASGFHNSYSRLSSSRPAVAVTSNMGKPSGTRCIHPTQHRGLTAREGARLQTFPDSFWFESGITSQRLQIANAVPPRLARALGAHLMAPASWTSGPAGDSPQLALDRPNQLEAA